MVCLDGKLSLIILTVAFILVSASHCIFGKNFRTKENTRKLTGKKLSLEDASGIESNPCDIKGLEIPAFNATGRRKSESKCYEYVWSIKKELHDYKMKKECEEYHDKLLGIQPTVLGGVKTKLGEFPHMGAVGWKSTNGSWIFKCGSALISPKFMLTAAHCSKASPRDPEIANIIPEIVRLGSFTILNKIPIRTSRSDAHILRIIVHPRYVAPKRYFDIAIIELKEPEKFHIFIKPACLWTQSDTSLFGTGATVTGWGATEMEGTISRKPSPELLAANVDIINSEICDELLRPFCNRLWSGLSDSQVCAGKLTGGIDTCQGDSGGPLEMNLSLPINRDETVHYLVGITSFGFGCGKENRPGVYTRVSSFLDWIENIVWPDTE